MRRLRRPALVPPTLTGDGKGARQAASDICTRTADPAALLSFPDHWNEPDVRGILYAMHGRVCAYCQSDLPSSDRGDVEHFRPKSIYWWLAYDFSNYLLSCRRCNQVCKRKAFPRRKGTMPFNWADRGRLSEEKILLLDPATDDVEAWVRFERLSDILFFAAPAKSLTKKSEHHLRAKTTIGFFRLNATRLVIQRSEIVYRAVQALDLALAGDETKAEEVRKMASRFLPHGAAVRQILSERAPDFIPSPEEDLLGLILDLLRYLDVADRVAARAQGNWEEEQRFRLEALWALAVLWRDPPSGSPDLVERCLVRSGRRDEVAGLMSQL